MESIDDFEDGEIESEEEGQEIERKPSPLITEPDESKPRMLATRQLMRPNKASAMSSGSESESEISDDDSDDCPPIRKRYRSNDLKMDQSVFAGGVSSDSTSVPKKKTNNIWGQVLQEENLTNTLGGMGAFGGLSKKECTVERDVESYDYNPEEFVDHESCDTRKHNSPIHDPFQSVIDSHADEIDLADLEKDVECDAPKLPEPKSVKDRLGSVSEEIKRTRVKDRLGSVEDMDSETTYDLGEKKDLRDRLQRSDFERKGEFRRNPKFYRDYDNLHNRDRSRDRKNNSNDDDRRNNRNLKRRRQDRSRGLQHLAMDELDDTVTAEDSDEKVTEYIADVLHEDKKHIIERVVKYCGKETALDLLKRTYDVESTGGLMTVDKSRRRAPGGVYIVLLKSDPTVEPDAIEKIFPTEERNQQKREMKQARMKRNMEKKEREKDQISQEIYELQKLLNRNKRERERDDADREDRVKKLMVPKDKDMDSSDLKLDEEDMFEII